MTTIYNFDFGFTVLGIATHPTDTPTISVINVATDALVVTAQDVTKSTTLTGACTYAYSGADNLHLIGLVHSTDATLDQQDFHVIPTNPTYTAVSLAVSTTQAAAAASGTIAITAGDSWTQVFDTTITADLSTAQVILAIKDSKSDTDDNSVMLLKKTGGLMKVNKATYATTGNGTLVVTGSSGDWHITATVQEAATVEYFGLSSDVRVAGLKYILSGGDAITFQELTATFNDSVVRAIT